MNSTMLGSSPLLGSADIEASGLSYLQSTVTRFRPELEMLWVLLTYSPFLAGTARYASSPKFTRARLYPYKTLLLHIVTGLLLVVRYHARFASLRVWPRPELADLVLFAAFNLSSFLLEAYRSSTTTATPVTRTGFQVSVLVQTVLFAASWVRGRDPALFRAAVKFFNWFASFRATAGALGSIDPRLAQMKHYAERYELTMVLSLCIGMWEAAVPAGVPVGLALVAVFMIAERAIAETVFGIPDSSLLKRLVLASGYVDHNLLRQKASTRGPPRPPR